MLTSGDIVAIDLGTPLGSEAGMRHPAVVVTADRILRGLPNVIQVVPLTRSIRNSLIEVVIEPDAQNGLLAVSAAQCQHVRSVAVLRAGARIGNTGPVVLGQIRDSIAVLVDL